MYVSPAQVVSAAVREERRDAGPPILDEYGIGEAEREAANVVVGYDNEGEQILETPGKWRGPRPPDPPPPRRPRGANSPNRERRAYVRELYARLYSTTEIYEFVLERFPGYSTRTIDEDLRHIRDAHLAAAADPQRLELDRARMVETITSLATEARAAGDRNTARFCYAQIAKIQGVYAPTKLEITTTTQTVPIQVDKIVGALDAEGLRALELVLGQLEAKGLAVVTPPEPKALAAPDEISPIVEDDVAEDLDDDEDDA